LSERNTRKKGFPDILLKLALSQTTSLLLILSFPNFNQGWSAWIALIPLIGISLSENPVKAFILGLLSSATALLGIFYWVFEVPGFRFYHALPLIIFYSLFTAAWCAGISWLRAREKFVFIFAPALWVALDYLKVHAGFLSFAWAPLAQSQHTHPVILQIGSVTGEYGITFLIVLVNVALAGVILRRGVKTAAGTAVLIGLCLIWSGYTLNKPLTGPAIRVAVVQPAIRLAERKTAEGRAASRRRLEQLTREAATFHPELVVWPETAIRDLKRHPELIAWLKKLASEIHATLIVGASEFVKFGKAKSIGKTRFSFKMREFNSAWFFSSTGGIPQPYHKRLLVPFGEYIPLASYISWPKWLVPEIFSSLPGKTFKIFPLSRKINITPIICWENLFSAYVRKAVDDKAQMVAHLVNDNWFGKTAAARQHNMASVLRAIENRVPVIIASNTGPSEIIGPYGRIMAKSSSFFYPDIITAEVPVSENRSFYTKNGDVFAIFCVFLALIIIFGHIFSLKGRK